MLFGEFSNRFDALRADAQEYMLEWTDDMYTTVVKTYARIHDEIDGRESSSSIWSLIRGHPVTEPQRTCIESDVRDMLEARLIRTEQILAAQFS